MKSQKLTTSLKVEHKCQLPQGKEGIAIPEHSVTCDWADLRHVLLPPKEGVIFGGEMYAQFEDGTVHYQDEFGRTTPENKYLKRS